MAPRKSEDRRKDVYLTITPMKTLSFESESLPVSLGTRQAG